MVTFNKWLNTPLSANAELILNTSARVARSSHRAFIGTEHLVVALCQNANIKAMKWIAKTLYPTENDVSEAVRKVRERILQCIGESDETHLNEVTEEKEPHLTAALQRSLDIAGKLGCGPVRDGDRLYSEGLIPTEFILAGLLVDGTGIGATALKRCSKGIINSMTLLQAIIKPKLMVQNAPEQIELMTPSIPILSEIVRVPIEDIQTMLATKVEAVCFDVDSTVSIDEGIDILAELSGCKEEVSKITTSAMGGVMNFEESLKARLDKIKPTRDLVKNFNSLHPPRLSNHVKELISLFQERGVEVYLVSGGFSDLIYPIAEILKIPKSNVFSNVLLFDDEGNFHDFDHTQPTCQDNGKAHVVQYIKETRGFNPIIMIGDGATDLQARPPADGFIGYGGVTTREKVKERADWFITDFMEIIEVLRNAGGTISEF